MQDNYQPDDKTRFIIQGAAANDKTLTEICQLCELSEATLKYHYPGELLPILERGLATSKCHQPTEQNRKFVLMAASSGMSKQDLSLMIGISVPTLYKYYRYELDTGHAKASLQIASKLFEVAMAGDVSALIFWAKTRMKWTDGPEVIETESLETVDMDALSLDQLRLLADLPMRSKQ